MAINQSEETRYLSLPEEGKAVFHLRVLIITIPISN